MAVNDFIAGLADLASMPADLAGMASAVVKTPYHFFAGRDNPFLYGLQNSYGAQIGQGIRDFNSDLFNSEEDNAWRRAGFDIGGFAADLFTGGSGRVARVAMREAKKGLAKQAWKHGVRALGETAVTNTAMNLAMNAITGSSASPSEAVMAGGAALYAPSMIRRASRKYAKRAKQLAELNAQTEAQRYKRDLQYYDIVDERSGGVRLAKSDGYDIPDEYVLSASDVARSDPIVQEGIRDLKNFDVRLAEENNRYQQLLSELQQRAKSIVSTLDDSVTPAKGLTTPAQLADDLARMEAQKEQVRAFKKAIGWGYKSDEEFADILRKMKFSEHIDLMNRYPKVYPEIGYLDPITGRPISNSKLIQEVDKMRKLLGEAETKKTSEYLGRVNRKDLAANFQEGLMTEDTYNKLVRESNTIGYIPKASMDAERQIVDGTLGVVEGGNMMRAATDASAGVMRQTNTFKLQQRILQTNAERRIMNRRTRYLMNEFKGVNEMHRKYYTSKIHSLAHNVDSLKGYEKVLAEGDLALCRQRLAELDKFKFNIDKQTMKTYFTEGIPEGTRLVQYFEKGEPIYNLIPDNHLTSLFKFDHRTNNNYIKGIQKTQNFMLQFRTGKYNAPNFAFVKAAYAMWEDLPALVSEARKRGLNLSYYEVMAEQIAQMKNTFSNEYYKWLTDSIEKNGSKFWFDQSDLPRLKEKIKDVFVSEYASQVDNFGDISRSPAHRLFDVVNMDYTTNREKMIYRAQQAWNWVDKSTPVEIMRIVNQAAGDSAAATISSIAKRLFPDNTAAMEDFLRDVSRKTSDTRRRGAGISKTGKTVNFLSDVMPYGKSSIQGLFGKADYFNLGENIDVIKNLLHTSKGMDKMIDLMVLMSGKTKGETFDMLWKVIVLPTTMCYLWNNMTPDQAEDYHELSTLSRSKNRLLVNFGGRGVHAYFPLDQEWSMLSALTEAILDSALNMSENDANNPDWSYNQQILKAAGRAFGIDFPAPVNAITKATAGFGTSINPETLLGDEDVFEDIRGKGLTARFEALLGEVLGTVGNSIVTLASDRPFNADTLAHIPLLTNSWTQEHNNSTAKYVDAAYKKSPANFPAKDLMAKRKYNEARLRHFKATGLTMDGRPYNMPRDRVIETITHNIHKLNGEMYKIIKEGRE